MSGYLCTEGEEGHQHTEHLSPHFVRSLSADWSYPEMDEHKLYHLWVTAQFDDHTSNNTSH